MDTNTIPTATMIEEGVAAIERMYTDWNDGGRYRGPSPSPTEEVLAVIGQTGLDEGRLESISEVIFDMQEHAVSLAVVVRFILEAVAD